MRACALDQVHRMAGNQLSHTGQGGLSILNEVTWGSGPMVDFHSQESPKVLSCVVLIAPPAIYYTSLHPKHPVQRCVGYLQQPSVEVPV